MASTKIGIAFHHGGIIPASVLKKDEDVTVAAHEAIEVPADYGQHLIDDKFAYAKDVEKVSKSKKAEATSHGASPVPVAAGASATAAEIAAAEKAVTDAEAEVAAAGDEAARKEAADQALASAKATLEKLKG